MGNNLPTDADLVGKALAGNREAFAGLYDRYARLVRAVVYGVALDWPMVQDMTQECFLRAYKNLDRLREADRFGRWMVGIARQVGKERRRSNRRNRHQYFGNDALEVPYDSDVAARSSRPRKRNLCCGGLPNYQNGNGLPYTHFSFKSATHGRRPRCLVFRDRACMPCWNGPWHDWPPWFAAMK